MLLFNDFDLEQYIIHEDIEIQELAERTNTFIDIPNMNGNVYTGYKYGQKKITIPFKIDAKTTYNYVQIVRNIKEIIHTDTPSKLFLPDELDKYYYAIIEEFTCQEIIEGVGEGSMTFICYDPYAYSDILKVCESNDENIVTVDNNGTATTYPLINVAFSKDSHFVQVTNWDGKTVLVGNRPNVDSSSGKPSTSVVNDPCESTANWLSAGNVVDSDRLVEGSVTISGNGDYITSGNFGTSNEAKWHGPAVRRNLGTNLIDFEIKARMIFKNKQAASSGGGGGTTTVGTYKVTPSALNLRSGAGTNYKVLTTIPKNTILTITSLSSNKSWGKTTYKSKTGWVSMTYLSKQSGKSAALRHRAAMMPFAENHSKVENRLGRAELYGFDKNGQKLFKVLLRDSEYYYEYIQPEAFIGNTLVLEDKKTCPAAKTKTVKEDGKNVTKKVESGRYGEWNDFYGEFLIKRETINKKQYWTIQVNKLVSNKVVKTLKTSTRLYNAKYPTGELNHIVLWLGKNEDKPVPDEIGLTDLKVNRLNAVSVDQNIINFSAGDELEIDCSENKVRLNGFDCMDKVDIGSEFFGCDVGTSQFACKSDDEDIYVASIIQEKWL